jgi:hypothetical protein
MSFWGGLAKEVAGSVAKGAASAAVSRVGGGGGGTYAPQINVPNMMGANFIEGGTGKGPTKKAQSSKDRGDNVHFDLAGGENPYKLMDEWEKVFKKDDD